MPNIGLSDETYNRLQAIKERFEKEHNATKSFDHVIKDLLDAKEKEDGRKN